MGSNLVSTHVAAAAWSLNQIELQVRPSLLLGRSTSIFQLAMTQLADPRTSASILTSFQVLVTVVQVLCSVDTGTW